MPKKKHVRFQGNVPGKFIPRDDLSTARGFRLGINMNQFNSKMVELLASSESLLTTINSEHESIPNATNSYQQNDSTVPISVEMATIGSSPVHSKGFHQRIVHVLETLEQRSSNTETASSLTSPRISTSSTEMKSQPITFGQLQQTTVSTVPQPIHSPTAVEEVSSSKISSIRSSADLMSENTGNKQSHPTNPKSLAVNSHSDPKLTTSSIPINKSSSKHRKNKEQIYCSPLSEQHKTVSQTKENEKSNQEEKLQQQRQKSTITVEEILANYYSKLKIPVTIETSQLSTHSNNDINSYAYSTSHGWNSSQVCRSQYPPPPPIIFNEQNRNRPPPPSYSFSIAHNHRESSSVNNSSQYVIRLPVSSSQPEQFYFVAQKNQPLLPGNSPVTSSTFSSPIMTNIPIRSPFRRHELSTTDVECSQSAVASIDPSNCFQTNPPQVGFDRKFSRLLYGKNRHRQQRRKAFSDPVKKSVEEAGRSIGIKPNHRLITHLNETDTVNEEENMNGLHDIDKQKRNLFRQKHLQQQSDLIKNTREIAKISIVPPNPLLNQRIPSFLRVYFQTSSSIDILLQWHLFGLSELQLFDAMTKKLYRDENLIRVQFYENYRTLLTSRLESLNNVHSDEYAMTTTVL